MWGGSSLILAGDSADYPRGSTQKYPDPALSGSGLYAAYLRNIDVVSAVDVGKVAVEIVAADTVGTPYAQDWHIARLN